MLVGWSGVAFRAIIGLFCLAKGRLPVWRAGSRGLLRRTNYTEFRSGTEPSSYCPWHNYRYTRKKDEPDAVQGRGVAIDRSRFARPKPKRDLA